MRASIIKALDHLDHLIAQVLPWVHKEQAVMFVVLIEWQLVFLRYNHRFEKSSRPSRQETPIPFPLCENRIVGDYCWGKGGGEGPGH